MQDRGDGREARMSDRVEGEETGNKRRDGREIRKTGMQQTGR